MDASGSSARLRFRVLPAPAPGAGGAPTERVVDVEPTDGAVRIGRRLGLELTLPFATISSLHARVVASGDGWVLEDLGSANGTFAEGNRLLPRAPQPLATGSTFRVADVTLGFEGDPSRLGAQGPRGSARAGAGEPRPESTATIARRLVSDLFGAARATEVARIVELGVEPARELVLPRGRIVRVGRAPTCDLVLDDDGVSREHAAIERRWDGIFVRDLGSKNGIEVAGRRAAGDVRVRDGEELGIAGFRFRVEDPEERYLRQLEQTPEAASPTAPVSEPTPAPIAAPPADAVVPRATPPPRPAPADDPSPRASRSGSGTAHGSMVPLVVGAVVLAAVVAVALYLALAG